MGAQAVRLSNVDIDNALKNKDFEVLFQPVFDLGNGALARVESFVRWRHPKLGLLPPGAFISFFESQGRMSELTRYVLGSALQSYIDWRGPWAPGLSVNLALSDLSDDAFTSHFTKLLRDYDFPAELVTLECPMPPVDMPIEAAKAHFERLSQTGARLAIEVRGRANELLRSLEPFPFDEIKTGGSAILRFARTVRGPGLSAIADLLDVANEANAAITAVGVEDQASLAALRGLGFTAAQGNHLGKVGDLNDFRPHRINEVRALLELEPLSQENLSALFRTEAPSVAPAETAADAAPAETENEDALIGRLNERVAQFDTPEETAASAAPSETQPDADEEKKIKAREKAKALALAKRAKARAERKNAAIERAKSKAAARPQDDITDVSSEDVAAPAPREMQERLNRAFTPDDATAKSPPTPAKPAADAAQGTPVTVTKEELHPPRPKETAPKTPEAGKPVAAEATSEDKPGEAKPQAPKQKAAPSIIERAMAEQSAVQQPAAAAPAAQPMMSMTVGASRAYFQPGIRVGAAALPSEPNKPVKPSPLSLPKNPVAPEPQVATPTPPQPAAEIPAATPEVPAPTAKSSVTAKEELGDLHEDTGEDTAALAVENRRPRRRKPLLKRRVYLSGYFWPRSWRRAWKRRAAANENNETETAGDTVQAAE